MLVDLLNICTFMYVHDTIYRQSSRFFSGVFNTLVKDFFCASFHATGGCKQVEICRRRVSRQRGSTSCWESGEKHDHVVDLPSLR